MKREDEGLFSTIKDATREERKKKALVFWSTTDESAYSGPVWPAGCPGALRVSALDQYGHLTPRSEGLHKVDIQVSGENIEAVGPSYMNSAAVGKTVSSSSIAARLCVNSKAKDGQPSVLSEY